MDFVCLPFSDLTNDQLYDLIALRTLVFVVEQDCPYQEADGKDKEALHLLGMEGGQLAGYSRILPPGVSYSEASLGRVVIHPDFRGRQLGYTLMEETMNQIEAHFGIVPVKISAQEHLRNYYGRFNFSQCGDGYLEDGIPHIPMRYEPVPNQESGHS